MADFPGIINQQQFDQAAAKWAAIVNEADGRELQQCFELPGGGPLLPYVSFPVQQIVQLVSTVGAHHIRARFLVTDSAPEAPRFTLALFAVDALDTRLSSYYLAEDYHADAAAANARPPGPPARGSQLGGPVARTSAGEVPGLLAQTWRFAWARAARATPQMFASPYGPLLGYTFELSDFLLPLFPFAQVLEERLLVSFGLHEYYRPGPDGDELATTFAPMVQVPTGAKEGDGDDPIFDMSKPIPPG